jgi:hypothetical protein
MWRMLAWRHGTQHNDNQHKDIQHKYIQNNDTHHKGLIYDSQHTRHSALMTLSITTLYYYDEVVMLSVLFNLLKS